MSHKCLAVEKNISYDGSSDNDINHITEGQLPALNCNSNNCVSFFSMATFTLKDIKKLCKTMHRSPPRYLHLPNETWDCLAPNNAAAQVSGARSKVFHASFEIMPRERNEQRRAGGLHFAG